MWLILCGLLVMSIGCKNKPKAPENEEVSVAVEVKEGRELESGKSETIDDCDEFIDSYEAWMGDYLALLEKYKDNPTDLISAPEYSQMTMQAAEWATSWSTKLATSCAANSGYEKRMREIQEKADKKLKEIGLRK